VHAHLPTSLPFHAEGVFAHLVATAVPGIEEWSDGAYHRSVTLAGGPAVMSLRPGTDHVTASFRLSDRADAPAAERAARWLLDLDADSATIDAALASDPLLLRAVRRRPGARVPRSTSGDELALRIVIGQQVSTKAAQTITGRLVAQLGERLPASLVPDGSAVTHVFPAPAVIAGLDQTTLPMPRRRASTLVTLAHALASGEVDLRPGGDPAALVRLAALPGIGPWTVSSVAMRALGDPDAFLPTDLGIVAAARMLGLESVRDLRAHSERWRPWRSYATQVLWGMLDHPINRLPR
jgi:AraC family transcriptional regulator, regulatory protein of adaptative response / DNA-3-methyladenine glycosylase II